MQVSLDGSEKISFAGEGAIVDIYNDTVGVDEDGEGISFYVKSFSEIATVSQHRKGNGCFRGGVQLLT